MSRESIHKYKYMILDEDTAKYIPQYLRKKMIEDVSDKPKGASTGKNLKMKFITWNIDGLSKAFLEERTKAVCEKIKEEDVDVVFLQEVNMVTMEYLINDLEDYYTFKFAIITDQYFVGTLLKRNTMSMEHFEMIPFPESRMDRSLLKINAQFHDIPLTLLNTHLESQKPASKERQNQLRTSFRHVTSQPENRTVIFAGDMNLRDYELQKVGLPPLIQDVWITCGSNPQYAYTWDMSQNSNLESFKDGYKPKLRFDRVYFSPSYPLKMKPTSLCFIGQEKLPGGHFPSDHWGILCHFEVQW